MGADLYRRILGSDWLLLHPRLRELHEAGASGTFQMKRGTSLAARLLLLFVTAPPESNALATRLTIKPTPSGEEWKRRFGKTVFFSRQSESEDSLIERFGGFEVRFRLRAMDGGLTYEQVGCGLHLGPLSMELPAAFAPRIEAREEVREGSDLVHVLVRVEAPVLGMLISYQGDVKAGVA